MNFYKANISLQDLLQLGYSSVQADDFTARSASTSSVVSDGYFSTPRAFPSSLLNRWNEG
jgi:hypothetical protein